MARPMDDVAVDADVRSALSLLTVAPDGDEYIVARPDLGVYVTIPRPGVVLIEALRDGASLALATHQASAAAGEEVDSADFLTGLGAAGLFDSPSDATGAGTRVGWVERIPQAAVRPLFGRVAWTLYVAAALLATLLLVMRPDLRPIFDDVWFLTDPIWSLLAIFAISLIFTAGHECWHWLAGRALGVPARFRISRRGVFLVFESDLSHLVTLPRRARYSPLLAGFAFDVVVLAVALVLRLGFREEILNHPPTVDRFLGAMVFRQIIVLVWQLFGVAFRSDSYAILANALGCHNLYRATALTGKYRLRRLSGSEAEELGSMSPRDRSVANWFWLVYLAGGFAMFTVLVTYLAPFAFGMIVWIGPNLTSLAPETLAFWQALALTMLLLAQFAVIPVIATQERRQARRAPRMQGVPGDRSAVRSRYAPAWRAVFVVLSIATAIYVVGDLRRFVEASSDATADNLIAEAQADSCLPGEQVPIMDFPHISEKAAASVVYNSNPATSGPHYGAAVAPGIYRSNLAPGQTVHALEHGRVVIHYLPDTPVDVIRQLESIAKRYAGDTVVHPNGELDAQIALTTWGRVELLDRYDEERIVRFVDELRGRYDHHATGATTGCDSEHDSEHDSDEH